MTNVVEQLRGWLLDWIRAWLSVRSGASVRNWVWNRVEVRGQEGMRTETWDQAWEDAG